MTPQICFTSAGCLIHKGKVLLVKHSKLGFWLNPGGHLEPGELPHQAAEREFWEETGIKVRAFDPNLLVSSDDSVYLPNPFACNLHWISHQNFVRRQQDPDHYRPLAKWPKGCEQHVCFLYLVKPLDSLKYFANIEETTDIRWFTRAELAELETKNNIKVEVERAFELFSRAK